ncbi:hypothetical protein WHZ77_06000 [Bradyrhizobium sp. A5]|uniref:hypothetical protein n=1 Tax=Bradyrhizobium sp. A5 TaxID=3133696 RepID=UPI00324BA4BD
MTERSKIVPIRRWPTPVPTRTGLVVTEHDIEIGEERDVYTIHRAVAPETGRGFMTIKDSEGAVLLVSRDVPDEYVPSLIIAYRAGVRKGIARGFSARAGGGEVVR